MKKLSICIILAALTASLIVRFPWEHETREKWHTFAQAVNEELN